MAYLNKTLAVCVAAVVVLASASITHAQQAGKVYRIGFLAPGSVELVKPWLAAFQQGLRELGYLDGKNTVIERRYAYGKTDLLPELAAELVRLKVDIIVTHGSVAVRIAKRATRTIPIVFAVAADPVGNGLVDSLARPGGNVTGLSDFHSNLVPKRLELLKEVVPAAVRVAVLWNLVNARQLKDLQAVAPVLGVTLLPLAFEKPDDLDRVFAALRKERPDALNVLGYPLVGIYRRQITAFALEHRLPTISTFERFVVAGGLMSYGANFSQMYRRAATFVDRIAKGATPADIPVEQPTRFDLVVNLKTAKALGITFPPSILLRADKVIE